MHYKKWISRHTKLGCQLNLFNFVLFLRRLCSKIWQLFFGEETWAATATLFTTLAAASNLKCIHKTFSSSSFQWKNPANLQNLSLAVEQGLAWGPFMLDILLVDIELAENCNRFFSILAKEFSIHAYNIFDILKRSIPNCYKNGRNWKRLWWLWKFFTAVEKAHDQFCSNPMSPFTMSCVNGPPAAKNGWIFWVTLFGSVCLSHF